MVKSAYHEDAFDEHGGSLPVTGWELAANVRRDGDGFPTDWISATHSLGQHLIFVTGSTATSGVYVEATLRIPDPDGQVWLSISSGRCLDTWEDRGDGFRYRAADRRYDAKHTEPVWTPWQPDHSVPKFIWGGPVLPTDDTAFGSAGPEDPSYSLPVIPEVRPVQAEGFPNARDS